MSHFLRYVNKLIDELMIKGNNGILIGSLCHASVKTIILKLRGIKLQLILNIQIYGSSMKHRKNQFQASFTDNAIKIDEYLCVEFTIKSQNSPRLKTL